jgi:hypothetical protein
MLVGVIDAEERNIIEGNFDYHGIDGKHPGVLPEFASSCVVASLHPHVVSQTINQRQAEMAKHHPYPYR